MPIIVGGTNYYIESLLWQILVEDPKESGNDKATTTTKIHRDDATKIAEALECEKVAGMANDQVDDAIAAKRHKAVMNNVDDTKTVMNKLPVTMKKMRYDDDEITNVQLHRMLTEVDPEMATRLHPNNRRKVIRSVILLISFFFSLLLHAGKYLSLLLFMLTISRLVLLTPGVGLRMSWRWLHTNFRLFFLLSRGKTRCKLGSSCYRTFPKRVPLVPGIFFLEIFLFFLFFVQATWRFYTVNLIVKLLDSMKLLYVVNRLW